MASTLGIQEGRADGGGGVASAPAAMRAQKRCHDAGFKSCRETNGIKDRSGFKV